MRSPVTLLLCAGLLPCSSGQDGLIIRTNVMASIGKAAWVDNGGSVSLRNLKIDNGCTSAARCPDGRGGSQA